jgi:hypothetical protein
MVESDGHNTSSMQGSQTASVSLPIRGSRRPRSGELEPGTQQRHLALGAPVGSEETLTARSTKTQTQKADDDPSDGDSIEMINYRGRPQSHIDFTGSKAF